MKVRVLIVKVKSVSGSLYSIFVYFDLFERVFVVKRKPMKKYTSLMLKKITSPPLYSTPTVLRNEKDVEKRINRLKSYDTFFIYYDYEEDWGFDY